MKFISIQEAVDKKRGKVAIRGWIYQKRELKDKIFLVLRDTSNIIQCIIAKKKISKLWKDAEKITIESSIEISGSLRQDKRAPTGYEIIVGALKIIGLAEKYPLQVRKQYLSRELLLDHRHLALRDPRMQAVLKIRSKVFEAIHEYFHSKSFYETHSPILLPGVAESGPDLFEVNFFGKKIYLTQTWQLYAEAMLPSLEKIYTITPAFRAERSKTTRHLAEYWTAEAEMAWYDLDDCIKVSEELITNICQKVAKECKRELTFLGRDSTAIAKIKSPFPKITYTQALKILKKHGLKLDWGKDLRTIEERKLMEHYNKPLIITRYPKKIMAFYKPKDPKDSRVALCYDILCPEQGIEIVGGSLRELNIEELKKSLKAVGEDPRKYEFYFDTRRYGSVPHSGFGLGIERIIQWICGLEDIKDAIPFPRTMERYRP